MPLTQIRKGPQQLPRRTLIYGVHGIGKSTFGMMAPKPIFIPTEDGIRDLNVHSFPLAETYDDLMTNCHTLLIEDHDYKTVVVDSLDWSEKLKHAEVCRVQQKKNIEDIGFGKGYAMANQYWEAFLGIMDDLNRKRGMNIIFIAHSKIERFNSPEVDPYDRFTPDLHKQVCNMIQEWCDEVLFANYKTFTKAVDVGFNKEVTRGIGSGERVLYTSERPSHQAKNRLSLPPEIPLDYEVYASYFNKKAEA